VRWRHKKKLPLPGAFGKSVSLFLVNDNAVAVHRAFDGDTEERVVIDVLTVLAAGGGAQGAATGERAEKGGNRSEQ